jgi:hypothetical protein
MQVPGERLQAGRQATAAVATYTGESPVEDVYKQPTDAAQSQLQPA